MEMNNPITQQIKIQKINHLRVGYGKDDISLEDYTESILSLDKSGNILKEERFSPDASFESLVLNEYNDQNILISSKEYDEENNLIHQVTYLYDDKKLLQQTTLYGEDCPQYVTRFVYEGDLLIKQEAYVEDDFESVEKTFQYNEKQLLTKEVHYDDDGRTQYIYEYDYQPDGLLEKMVKIEVLEKDKRTYEYTYDNAGNRVKILVYNYQEQLIAKTYQKFTDDNLLFESEEEDLNSYKKTVYQREGNLLMKVSIYGRNDELQSWMDFEYDESGRNTKMVNYIKDETDEESYRILYELIRHYTLPEA